MTAAKFILPRPALETPHDVVVYPRGLGWARFSPEQPDLPGGDFEVCMPDGRRFTGSWAVVGVEDIVWSQTVTELRLRGFAARRLSWAQYQAIGAQLASVHRGIKFDRMEARP